MSRFFARVANVVSLYAGHPVVFTVASATILAWVVTGPMFHFSVTWQLVINTGTTIITFLMVFLIQNSQNRDSAAIQTKLDELIRAVAEAREDFIGLEHLTHEEVEQVRTTLEEEVGRLPE